MMFVASCTTTDEITGERSPNRTGTGAIIGAIVGGGKGAAIGAAAGGGAGTARLMVTRGKNVRVPRGTLVAVRLTQPARLEVRGTTGRR
jgi:hypothetical protein